MAADQQTSSDKTKLPDYVIGHDDRVVLNCLNCGSPVHIEDPITKSVRDQEAVCSGCGAAHSVDIHLCACLVPKPDPVQQPSTRSDSKT